MIKYRFDYPLERYCKIVLYQIRRIPVSCRVLLQRMQLYPDLVQEAYALAVEAHKKNLPIPRETSNFAQRGLYRFLKSYGFVRDGKSYVPKVMAESFLKEVEDFQSLIGRLKTS